MLHLRRVCWGGVLVTAVPDDAVFSCVLFDAVSVGLVTFGSPNSHVILFIYLFAPHKLFT